MLAASARSAGESVTIDDILETFGLSDSYAIRDQENWNSLSCNEAITSLI